MRDQNEISTLGYNRYLGFCPVIEVELWDILDGLTILLERNYDSVLIQIDSMEAILAIQNRAPNELVSTLVRRILQNLA
ncbi:hypothetical protein Gogos_013041, partial [Gossypium gossypioides]|nr:hypothetical protein [Gossypium gossypioides]